MADTEKVLTFTKNLTIDRANEIKDAIAQALDRSEKVMINAGGAEKVDLSFIHLLHAAARSAAARGKEFHLTGTAGRALREALTLGGFCCTAPEDARTLEHELFEFRSTGSGSDDD